MSHYYLKPGIQILCIIHLFIGGFLFICLLIILYRYEYEMVAYR